MLLLKIWLFVLLLLLLLLLLERLCCRCRTAVPCVRGLRVWCAAVRAWAAAGCWTAACAHSWKHCCRRCAHGLTLQAQQGVLESCHQAH
jgi:hypothetical protein